MARDSKRPLFSLYDFLGCDVFDWELGGLRNGVDVGFSMNDCANTKQQGLEQFVSVVEVSLHQKTSLISPIFGTLHRMRIF
mmetsp:Transcript_43332/g.104725  ORF Transcript_43332/g.104725 Transcript_43332/m.104725 type:complete len:81 (+) Transcript_43332:427-669(+)